MDDLFVTYDVNVRTAVQVVQAVLPGMLDAGWGRIVNVTSLTTLGVAERTPYAASKAALDFFAWCYSNGAELANSLDYVTLPAGVIKMVQKTWTSSILQDGKPVWNGK